MSLELASVGRRLATVERLVCWCAWLGCGRASGLPPAALGDRLRPDRAQSPPMLRNEAETSFAADG